MLSLRLISRDFLLPAVCLTCLVACDQASSSAAPAEVEKVPLDLVLDDFEDGDLDTPLGSAWYRYSDVDNGGGSSIEISSGEGFDSERALVAQIAFEQKGLPYEPYVGFGASLGSESEPMDLSEYATLQYSYKGAKHSVRLETFDVTDYDYHGVVMPASSSWKTVELSLPLFTQENWGVPVAFDPAHIVAVSFHLRGASGEQTSLHIDDLGVVKQAESREPDMEVKEPAPPAPVAIESISIDNPLQALAMESLDRGYNITNWLEQERFESFRYDEAFVAALADAGFKSLRLPIDLDLYVEEISGSGSSIELTLHDDLFEILDSFEAWTRDSGLSLTIDYHQYDRSLDFGDPESMDVAVAVWEAVAKHFADNPRQDLFFELLNEPELSVSGAAPSQAEWTKLAEAMVAAIRKHDERRTLIFGDVEWYGIGPLSRREPLSDDNVIYAFHFYDPFIFTHQGASWANLGTTHDIPYPYAPERWSEYSAELGFTPFMESWILNDARNYYRTGNREALKNRIAIAKKWAVDHGVPVICNEFGAYDATSLLEDRVNYYTDLIGIFAELEIPWQHWFMIMDETGSVLPEYRAAFGLK